MPGEYSVVVVRSDLGRRMPCPVQVDHVRGLIVLDTNYPLSRLVLGLRACRHWPASVAARRRSERCASPRRSRFR